MLLADLFNFCVVGLDFDSGYFFTGTARPASDDSVMDQDHTDIIGEFRVLFEFCNFFEMSIVPP